MNAAEASALVASVICKDPVRMGLNKAIGFELHGVGYVGGTDGHRVHAVRCDDWKRLDYGAEAVPLAPVCTFSSLMHVGGLNYEGLEAARAIPRKWHANLLIGPRASHLFASLTAGAKRKAKCKIFDNVRVDWALLENASDSDPIGINLHYLLDAFDFIGTKGCDVWRSGIGMSPIVFTRPNATLATSARFAVVMPVRL